ncbi:MAG TPA: Kdo hydroxylase family protein, partial [Rhizomicrobium sp.]
LRFFANVAPDSTRHWHVGEPFEDFARAFLPRVVPHWPGKSWLYETLGVTHGRRSLYDEYMLSLHDTAKRDDGFQKTSPHQAVSFPPGSCWLVFTDQVLHAALGGEFALEQTFHLDIDQLAEPARAPVKVLERLSGKALV